MRVGVLGIGKTPHKIQHGKSLRDLAVESGRAAMADAGVEPSDIQSLYVGNVGSVGFNYENSTGLMVAHHLGVVPAGSVRVEQVIYVARDSQKRIVLGEKGQTIKAISMAARKEITEIAEKPVHLFLFVKVRENWSDDPERYREMGLEFPKA